MEPISDYQIQILTNSILSINLYYTYGETVDQLSFFPMDKFNADINRNILKAIKSGGYNPNIDLCLLCLYVKDVLCSSCLTLQTYKRT